MQQSMFAVIREWRATTDPVEKGLLFDLIQSMLADLGFPASGTAGCAGDSDAAGSGQGGDKE